MQQRKKINRMPWGKGKLLIIFSLFLSALSYLLLRQGVFAFEKGLSKAFGLMKKKIVRTHFWRIISPGKTEKAG